MVCAICPTNQNNTKCNNRYIYNHVEPEHYPYVGKPPTTWDFTTFNFIFWQRMDKRIEELRDAGVQVRWSVNQVTT